MTASQNDKPISKPSDDRYGFDPFAKALAASIVKMREPEGTVIALNGAWGSGKSSAVNLALYHLNESKSEDITVINFACWWFRGEEQLALAFFRELYAGLGLTLGDRFKKLLPKIGARLLRAGAMVGPAVSLAGAPGVGAVASGTMSWLSGLIEQDDTVEKLHGELSAALAEQKRRFVIVIDDIDRLAPDEALLIFRLVKSVGQLPNVIYLLVFDRQLAEAIVGEKYPSEGSHYLEKIIQAGFDIPEPRQGDLRQELLEQIGKICGSPESDGVVRFMNVFYDVVAPEIKTPRDLIRYRNSLTVTWPAVGNDVDRADFVGLEIFRVLRPAIYRALRVNKSRLTDTQDTVSRRSQGQRAQFDEALLSGAPEAERERLRRALARIFPTLDSVWGNLIYGEESKVEWARQRRVCASDHFDSYFRFTISDGVLARQEIDDLISHAADEAFITAALRAGLSVKRASGGTKAALILDELNRHADSVPDDCVQPLLAAIFRLGDELDVPDDEAKGFAIGNNSLRIHWLLRRLTLRRFGLAQRSAIFRASCEGAALGWLSDFAASAYEDYHPRAGKPPEEESSCLTTSVDAETLRSFALAQIRKAAQTGALCVHARLAYLLYRWRDFVGDDGVEVKRWCAEQLTRDEAVVQFAKAFTSHGWSQGGDDTVAQRTTLASVDHLELLLDKGPFRVRVEELAARDSLAPEAAAAVGEFLKAWSDHDKLSRPRPPGKAAEEAL